MSTAAGVLRDDATSRWRPKFHARVASCTSCRPVRACAMRWSVGRSARPSGDAPRLMAERSRSEVASASASRFTFVYPFCTAAVNLRSRAASRDLLVACR
ncbi:hypothetical protein VFPFJ_03030 [Purpureocillium lilacinum]|uniref:Uncharacterized protein n=1 Tax=Purpureocillium lilacinum TaxID=33203 RepID=A0A179HU18_PURLI|nr:hypothetical protein VFPFJ_03030 [Purpureocillium lilacinum]OAQ93867.1 hypothetical protein VFPFJ_03030 [Purpureocillium lilacinum]